MVDFDVGRSRGAWWVAAVVLALAVVYVLYSFIGTFIFGVFVYYASRPAFVRIQRRVGNRSLAAGLSLSVFALPAVTLLAYTVAIGVQELVALDGIGVEPLRGLVEPYVDLSQVVTEPREVLSQGGVDAIGDTAVAMLSSLGIVGTGLLHLFVIFALAFYLLRDLDSLTEWLGTHTGDLPVLELYLRAVDRDLESVFFGNILNAIVTGAIGMLAFSLLNLVAPAGLAIPYPALTGLLAGAASLIPVVGMKIVYVPVVGYLGVRAVTLGTGLWFVGLLLVVSFVLVDSVPDFFLRPYVSGRDLHIGMVMLAYVLGPLLFGWYGLFLGPAMLVVLFHFVRIVVPELIAGKRIKPLAVGPAYLDWSADDGATSQQTADDDGNREDSAQ